MPDVGSKLLNPMANYVGTYRNLWQRLGDPAFDVSAWQAMYRWVNDSVPFAGAAFRQWIVEFYQDNRLSRDMLEMDGRPVRLADIRCPGAQHRREPRPDRAAGDDERRHETRW